LSFGSSGRSVAVFFSVRKRICRDGFASSGCIGVAILIVPAGPNDSAEAFGDRREVEKRVGPEELTGSAGPFEHQNS
jgi:hypothetical protein